MPGGLPKSLDLSQYCNATLTLCKPVRSRDPDPPCTTSRQKTSAHRRRSIPQMRSSFRLSGRSLYSHLGEILMFPHPLRRMPYGMDIAKGPSRRHPEPCPPHLVLFSASYTLKQQGIVRRCPLPAHSCVFPRTAPHRCVVEFDKKKTRRKPWEYQNLPVMTVNS